MPREYDPVEEALVEKAARDALELLNAHRSTRVSRYLQSGPRLLRVTVAVVPPEDVPAARREMQEEKGNHA